MKAEIIRMTRLGTVGGEFWVANVLEDGMVITFIRHHGFDYWVFDSWKSLGARQEHFAAGNVQSRKAPAAIQTLLDNRLKLEIAGDEAVRAIHMAGKDADAPRN